SRTGAGSLVRGPPGNARVPREPDPPGRRGLCLCLRTRGVFCDPEEELRRLLLEAFVPSPEAPIGRAVDESRRRTLRGHRRRSASLALRPRAFRPQGAFIADIEIVKDRSDSRPRTLGNRASL